MARVNVRLPDEEMKKLMDIAERQETTVSEVIRAAIRNSIGDSKTDNLLRNLTEEIRELRKDLDYLIDKDKRREIAESRVI
ncbi:MAG: ribbon-helix-helix domain-containing protein [Candidatus Thermoplasmatota archaeon]|nr:ribbon-helix-helix domain-containing protein [Candidatus Thermoplasmatota archaeon]